MPATRTPGRRSGPRRATAAQRESPFDALKEMGVTVDAPLATWQASPHPHHEDAADWRWEHRALRVTWEEADILLWSNIGQDIGIRPVAPVLATLIDRERAIAVLAYDDRGMDVTALVPEELIALYRHFDAWLLDHDRPRMAAAFGRRKRLSLEDELRRDALRHHHMAVGQVVAVELPGDLLRRQLVAFPARR